MSRDFRFNGRRAGDAEALLLAAGEPAGPAFRPVLDFVPEVGAAKRAFDDPGSISVFFSLRRFRSQARRRVLVDRHGRKRVRLLEDHADLLADQNRIHRRR